jgi:hypothetical protein
MEKSGRGGLCGETSGDALTINQRFIQSLIV